MPSSFTTLSPEDRAAALEKAKAARTARAELKASLKRGEVSLPDVLKRGADDEIVAKTKVTDLIRAVPGVGEVRAAQIMERLGIDAKRRVRGLGANQRSALAEEFAA